MALTDGASHIWIQSSASLPIIKIFCNAIPAEHFWELRITMIPHEYLTPMYNLLGIFGVWILGICINPGVIRSQNVAPEIQFGWHKVDWWLEYVYFHDCAMTGVWCKVNNIILSIYRMIKAWCQCCIKLQGALDSFHFHHYGNHNGWPFCRHFTLRQCSF